MNLAPGAGVSFSNTFNSRAIFVLEGADVSLWIKTFDLPELSVEHIEVPRTPQSFKVQGNIIKFNDLSVTFFLDDYFNVYYRLYDWFMKAIAGPDNKDMKSNGSIFVMNNQLTEINTEIRFSGIMIKNIPSLSWNTTTTEPMTLAVGFAIDQFTPIFKKAVLTNPK